MQHIALIEQQYHIQSFSEASVLAFSMIEASNVDSTNTDVDSLMISTNVFFTILLEIRKKNQIYAFKI